MRSWLSIFLVLAPLGAHPSGWGLCGALHPSGRQGKSWRGKGPKMLGQELHGHGPSRCAGVAHAKAGRSHPWGQPHICHTQAQASHMTNRGRSSASVQDEASDLCICSSFSPSLSPDTSIPLHRSPPGHVSSELPLHNSDNHSQHLFSPMATTPPHLCHLLSNRHVAPGCM